MIGMRRIGEVFPLKWFTVDVGARVLKFVGKGDELCDERLAGHRVQSDIVRITRGAAYIDVVDPVLLHDTGKVEMATQHGGDMVPVLLNEAQHARFGYLVGR